MYISETSWKPHKTVIFRVPGTESRVPGTESRVPGTELWVHGTEIWVHGTEIWVHGTENRLPGTEYRLPGTEYRLPGTEYTMGWALAIPWCRVGIPRAHPRGYTPGTPTPPVQYTVVQLHR